MGGETCGGLARGAEPEFAVFGNPSSEAAAFRSVVPWSRIVELIEARE